MIGTSIYITNELAIKVGELAKSHPNTTVAIAHDDDYPEQEWLVKLDAGWGDSTYVVNDETGEYRPAGMGEGNKL